MTVRFLACLLFATLAVAAAEKRIVILGDSIAAGYGVETAEAFPALLQEKIAEAKLPFKIVNAGVSGDTTASGLRRINWLLREPIDVLLLELGGNDGLRGIPPSATRTNLQGIVTRTLSKNPKTKIIIAGMRMPDSMGEEIPFLLEGVGGKADLNQDDRIHPNPAGHKIVAATVWRYLEPTLRSFED
jgi:acyl-CoA thioesterase I